MPPGAPRYVGRALYLMVHRGDGVFNEVSYVKRDVYGDPSFHLICLVWSGRSRRRAATEGALAVYRLRFGHPGEGRDPQDIECTNVTGHRLLPM